VFNIGGGATPTSINEVLDIVARLTDTRPEPVHTETRAGDVRKTEADVTRAGDLIGYRPRVGIEDGLGRTVDWFRAPA
jgi:nucleoside-diphosphate-sugar epimerase